MAGVEPPAAEPLDWKLRLRVVVQRLTQPTCACMVAMTAPAFVNLDYTPTFTPILLRKDFDLGLAAARQLDVSMPIAAATAQLVQATVGSGRVDEDFAILLDQQAAASGIELKPENVVVDDGLGSPDGEG